MAEYSLDKYEFKKYLLAELSDTRQEELIFWKGSIPMPVDLIYNIFEKRGSLFSTYLDHIGAAYLFAWSEKEEQRNWKLNFRSQPTKGNSPHKSLLLERFSRYFDKAATGEILIGLSELFLLDNYHPTPMSLVEALCHEGRKYNRLYIPNAVRLQLNEKFPELLTEMSLRNWDMFSNVIADELKIYRMGFADAFNGIFIKLIEFILKNSSGRKKDYVSATGFDLVQGQVVHEPNVSLVYGNINDGSVWEPVYTQAKTSAVMNKKHPFCDQLRKSGSDAQDIVSQLFNVMAEKENEIIRDRDKKVIEIFRQDVSRELRMRVERNLK